MNRGALFTLILLLMTAPLAARAEGTSAALREVVPWGDLVFLDEHRLIAPYAMVEGATAEERRKAGKALEHWQHAPVGEIVDELSRSGGGKDGLSRALMRLFVEAVREHPGIAQRQIQGMRWVREMGLRILGIENGRLHERRRIPVWRGRARVDDRVEQVPGQHQVRVELANLRVGVRIGGRHVVAWVSRLPGSASVFLDRGTLQVEQIAKGFVPLAWTGEETLLGWRRNDKGQPMIGLYSLVARGELHALALSSLASPGALAQVRPLYTGAPPLAAVLVPRPWRGIHEQEWRRHAGAPAGGAKQALLCSGFRAWLMDLRRGERTLVGANRVWTSCAMPAGPFLWATADMAGGIHLIRLEPTGEGTLRESAAWPLPGEGFWFGPVGFDGSYLWLLRDPGVEAPARGGPAMSTTTSRRAEIWRVDPLDGRARRASRFGSIELDSGKLQQGARLIAVSPDGGWVAVRVDGHHVALHSLIMFNR